MQARILILLILFSIVSTVSAKDDDLRLGVVVDCQETTQSGFLIERILQETKTLLKSDFNVVLRKEKILYSECESTSIQENIDRLQSDSEVDIVLSVNAIGSHILARGGPYEKPSIASIVINPQAQQLPLNGKGASGIRNLNYVILPYSPQRDLEVFHDMVEFKNIAVILNELVFNSIPALPQFLEKNLKDLGTDYKFIFTDSDVDKVISQIDDDNDAVYYLPDNQLSQETFNNIFNRVNEKGLPSFALTGRLDVNNGVLAGIAPVSNIDRLARRVAINIQRIATGEKAEKLSVSLPYKEELVINMETARQIGYSPDWDIISEALLINEERTDISRKVNIYSVIAEGIEKNLNISIAKKQVESSVEDVNIAKSNLLPQVDVSANHTLVNANLAEVSNGQNPQNKGQASLTFSQVLYSEGVNANKQIQELLLKSTEAALEIETLDIILQVSEAYLNLLRAKTGEQIQKQNLDLTRKNLELARVSSSIGQSGPSDVYRWQSEIATARANLLNATAQRIQAEYNLNQLLYRPIAEPFITEELDITDSNLLTNDNRVGQYINNPREFYIYADFIVEETKRNLPALKQFDYNIAVQERTKLLNRRNLYAPTFTLAGGTNYELYRGGKGTDFPPGFMAPNDQNWSVQLGASLPIFTGFNRKAQLQQSKVQLNLLRDQRENLERQLEQLTRSELENVRASFTNIGLTSDAEEAAVRNFELIQDSYSKGVVTITQLLDAQNAAISAQLNSANASYIFMIDLLNMERATGEYYMLFTEDQKVEYTQRLKEFYDQRN